MTRLLLEDVTLLREQQEINVRLRFKGGATRELRLPFPKSAWALRKTKPEIIAEIDRLLEEHLESEVAEILNQKGWRSSAGNAFPFRIVNHLRWTCKLKTRYQRLRERGLLTAQEVSRIIGGAASGVKGWRHLGVLCGTRYNEKHEYLYPNPSRETIAQIRRRRGLRGRKTMKTDNDAQSSQ